MENGYAPGHSKAAEQASKKVAEAEQQLMNILKADYPEGHPVRVVHYRGEFTGTVVGWSDFGCRVFVLNDSSQKTCGWWSRHVELI